MNNKIYATLQSSINGDGLWFPSISIYYGGCDKPVKCKGCHNAELHQQGVGFCTTTPNLIEDIEKLLGYWYETFDTMALCFVGGEPLAKWNRDSVMEVAKYFKSKYGSKICIILYSWRYISDINNNADLKACIKYVDYGVLGEFIEEQKDLRFVPASANQYIYDFKESKMLEKIRKDMVI